MVRDRQFGDACHRLTDRLLHPLVIVGSMDDPTLSISCDECAMQHTAHCRDCVVTFILGREPDDAVVIDAQEARAFKLLIGAGLVPDLRHVQRSG